MGVKVGVAADVGVGVAVDTHGVSSTSCCSKKFSYSLSNALSKSPGLTGCRNGFVLFANVKPFVLRTFGVDSIAGIKFLMQFSIGDAHR